MTPVQGWSEHDYFRASRGARTAWAKTDAQLTLGLDEPQVSRAAGNSAAACGSSSPTSGLAAGDGSEAAQPTETGRDEPVPTPAASPPFAAVADSPRGGLAVPAEKTGAQPSLASPATEAAAPLSVSSVSAGPYEHKEGRRKPLSEARRPSKGA